MFDSGNATCSKSASFLQNHVLVDQFADWFDISFLDLTAGVKSNFSMHISGHVILDVKMLDDFNYAIVISNKLNSVKTLFLNWGTVLRKYELTSYND